LRLARALHCQRNLAGGLPLPDSAWHNHAVPIEEKEVFMAKVLECAKVDPSSGCQHIVRGETEEEVLRKAGEHAKEHGIRDVTPQLVERIKASIHDA
jgi:predicted small metal-binding protein